MLFCHHGKVPYNRKRGFMKNLNNTAVFISQLLFPGQLRSQSEGGLVPDELMEDTRDCLHTHNFALFPRFQVNLGEHGKGEGYLLLLNSPAKEFIANKAKASAEVIRAVKFAQENLGATIVGLGSLTTPVTNGGEDVVKACGDGIDVTHGDSGSVAMLWSLVTENLKLTTNKKVAVVGATGLIGTAISQMLNARGNELVLIGRSEKSLTDLGESMLNQNFTLSKNIKDVNVADMIITVTSGTDVVVMPDMVKDGAIIVDPAAPPNVSSDPMWAEKGVMVISNACQVRVPGLAVKSEMFGTTKEMDDVPTTYACLAETMVLAALGIKGHRIGPINLTFVNRMVNMFRKIGFTHALPRMFGDDPVFKSIASPPFEKRQEAAE